MPRCLRAIAVFLLTVATPLALSAQTSNLSKAAGRYVAGAYQGITNSVTGGPYATGTVNIQLAHPWIETPDGRTVYPYSTSLPVTIFNFALSPYEDWQHLAWAGALLIALAVLIINLVVRILATRAKHP